MASLIHLRVCNEYFHLFRQSETVIIVEIDHHDAYGKTNYNSFYRIHTTTGYYNNKCWMLFTEEVKRVQILIFYIPLERHIHFYIICLFIHAIQHENDVLLFSFSTRFFFYQQTKCMREALFSFYVNAFRQTFMLKWFSVRLLLYIFHPSDFPFMLCLLSLILFYWNLFRMNYVFVDVFTASEIHD